MAATRESLEAPLAEHESSLAVLVDFENMARPGVKGRGDFDIHLVLDRLAEKGRVLVKRAYADWSRYRDARHELQNAGLGLIEMPSAREGAKNRADIQMAVDAMELAYSREHVDNFVIVSGDSDFTPLVGKLRELNKRVIGVGNRESASDLLVANCDEFIYYDSLAARATGGTTRRRGGAGTVNPAQLLQETLIALQREGTEWPLASVVKDSMRRKYPAFDETDHGFSTFSKLLEEAAGTGMIKIETDPRSGTYRVELGDTTAAPPVAAPSAAPAAERTADDGEGRRRRRRGGRRPEPSVTESVEVVEAADVVEAVEGAEVFEVVVKPRPPDPDLGALPPLDQPISYEDMIMLGPAPEAGEDNPDLVEVSDVGAEEPPSRSSRRRRRRAAVAEPEPTVADLEPVDDLELIEPPEVPASIAEVAPVAELAGSDVGDAGTGRRRRRRTPTAAAEALVPSPVVEATEVLTPTVDVEGPAVAVPDPAAPAEAPPAPGGRRVRRRSAATTPDPAAPEGPAEGLEEAPKPRRRAARKKADPAAEAAPAEAAAEAPAAEEAVEEAPKPRRRTRRAATAPSEAPAANGDAPEEEAPKPRRRAPRKKAEPAADAPADDAAAEEAPTPRRRASRKKAEPAETSS
jgi:uncharacterized protein (TIGR00288 family)